MGSKTYMVAPIKPIFKAPNGEDRFKGTGYGHPLRQFIVHIRGCSLYMLFQRVCTRAKSLLIRCIDKVMRDITGLTLLV